MKLVAVLIMLASPLMVMAEEVHFGVGVSATSYSYSFGGGSSFSNSSLGVFARFPADAANEIDLGVSLLQVESRSSGETDTSTGFAFDLGWYGTMLEAGPAALKSGVSGRFSQESEQDYDLGTGSVSSLSATVPLIFDFKITERWVVRLAQPVMVATSTSEKLGGVTGTQTTLQINVGLAPTVSVYYMF